MIALDFQGFGSKTPLIIKHTSLGESRPLQPLSHPYNVRAYEMRFLPIARLRRRGRKGNNWRFMQILSPHPGCVLPAIDQTLKRSGGDSRQRGSSHQLPLVSSAYKFGAGAPRPPIAVNRHRHRHRDRAEVSMRAEDVRSPCHERRSGSGEARRVEGIDPRNGQR